MLMKVLSMMTMLQSAGCKGLLNRLMIIITIYFNKKRSPKLAERCGINVSINIMIVNQSFYKVCQVQNGRLVLASIKVCEPIVQRGWYHLVCVFR